MINTKKKTLSFVIAAVMSLSLALSACGAQTQPQAQDKPTVSPAPVTEDAHSGEAAQLLSDLKGSYQELWPVAFDKKYDDVWLESCKAAVGEKDAQATADKLKASVSGTLSGQDAVDAYKDNPDGSSFYCGFSEGVVKFTFDGAKISGLDKDGKELFSHEYSYIGYDGENGFYEYQSKDADSGEFTYFFLRSDTPATTWHIEFRYGSDAKALSSFTEGRYAYWMASGIGDGCTDDDVKSAVNLFCTENLQQK